MADAVRGYMKADVGFVNSGGIRKDMIAGPITLRDIWEISPFGNELVSFSVTGRQLESMMKYQGEKDREFCQVSGLIYAYDRKTKALTMTVGGAPVDPAKVYKVATSNFVASHISEVFGLSDSDIRVEAPIPAVIDRDVYIDLIRRQKNINSRLEGRIRITGE
jgi:2',3'-cyclic-nucleotide 2'-phosphodiesterase (5'-nucleotidase family)